MTKCCINKKMTNMSKTKNVNQLKNIIIVVKFGQCLK